MEMLISLIVEIISQYIYISEHQVAHLKCVQCLFFNYTSIKPKKPHQMNVAFVFNSESLENIDNHSK